MFESEFDVPTHDGSGTSGSRDAGTVRTRTARLMVVASCLGVLSGCIGDSSGATRTAGLNGWMMDTPIPKPGLVLTDTNGEPFSLREQTEGYITLLFFGYTHCPDICPVHMANLGIVLGNLTPEVRNRIKVVFVSTDPDRDDATTLRAWLDGFDRTFIGLRGPIEDVNAALGVMMMPSVAVFPSEHGEDADPVIGHPAAVLAFGTDNLARVRYPFGTRQADWANDLPLLVGGG